MDISALDEDGKPVDWWFIYKVPKLRGGVNGDGATGYEYVYFDPTRSKVDKSPNLLSEGKGAMNLTLDAIFHNADTTTGWILYNDELPESLKLRDDGNLGHTKGVLAFDTATNTGLWLLHSWPKFADPDAAQSPTPDYGQTYLCITLDLDSIRAIAQQMTNHQEPQVYHPRLADLPATDPICLLAKPLNPNSPADSDVIELKSRGGLPFKVIAKNRAWNRDFWNELVGPTLGEDIDVESWIRGAIPPVSDTDGIHKTFDIKFINLGWVGLHWAWPETSDHAKWAITTQSDWVCVGDINRMISQRQRGGGTIAFQNPILWLALTKTNLLLAPPGHTRTAAHALIHESHKKPLAPQAGAAGAEEAAP